MNALKYQTRVEKWDILEVECQGPSAGNPFIDNEICGTFTSKCESTKVTGFYDGQGTYKVRFMPSFEGTYTFTIQSNFAEVMSGEFTVTAPGEGNHGPVRVANTYHFAYA